MIDAARRDRADVVALLLDLGVSPDVDDGKEGSRQRPLHAAAYGDAREVIRLLVDRGAAIDPREEQYGATPLWLAVWAGRRGAIELLAPHSRDPWGLTAAGEVERLRAVLRDAPALARSRSEFETPLMWLPGDEDLAFDAAALLLDHGADARVRNRQGKMAADLAEKREMPRVAALLRERETA